MMRLLNRYGAADMDLAVKEALVAGVQHPNAVRLDESRHPTLRAPVLV
jgi:hypothetical protein